jgi:hypothetical protein
MKLVVLLFALGVTTPAFADDYDACVARRHVLEAQMRDAPPGTQVALDRELPVCRSSKPPLSGGRLGGEFLLGAAAGIGGGFLGAVIGVGVTKDGCEGEDWCGLGGAIVGGYIGAVLAPPMAVYLVGASGDQTGSVGATFGGALLGGAVGLAAGIGVGRANTELGVGVAMAGPVVGAMVGFNLSRRYKVSASPPAVGSLITVDRGRVALGAPIVIGGHGVVGLSLAGGSF